MVFSFLDVNSKKGLTEDVVFLACFSLFLFFKGIGYSARSRPTTTRSLHSNGCQTLHWTNQRHER